MLLILFSPNDYYTYLHASTDFQDNVHVGETIASDEVVAGDEVVVGEEVEADDEQLETDNIESK